jgi:hypothetical protein
MTQTASPVSDAYIPGVCNINHVEIAYRRKIGYIGLAVFIVLLAILLALPISRYTRIILFLPAFLGAEGFLQAKNKFCVGYAAAGKQNAAEGSDSALDIIEKEAIAKDKKRARQMNLQATAIGVIVTIVSLLIPVFSH